MDRRVNALYNIIERDFGIVICDNRANNGCFPNYKVEIRIEVNRFDTNKNPYYASIFGWENGEIIYSFRFYLSQEQMDEIENYTEEEENIFQ